METGTEPIHSMKELRSRKIACFDFDHLEDGERKMIILPAWDMRGGAPEDSKYGQHCAELVFGQRLGNKTVSVEFYTGWTVDGSRMMMNGHDALFMCTGLYTHYHQKTPDTYENKDCPWTGGDCWGEMGSSLYGETILDRLIHEGSAGVWDEIRMELEREPAE